VTHVHLVVVHHAEPLDSLLVSIHAPRSPRHINTNIHLSTINYHFSYHKPTNTLRSLFLLYPIPSIRMDCHQHPINALPNRRIIVYMISILSIILFFLDLLYLYFYNISKNLFPFVNLLYHVFVNYIFNSCSLMQTHPCHPILLSQHIRTTN